MPRRRTARPREIFLSHSSRTRAFASRLERVLRRHGLKVWYSRKSIQAARQWHDEIGNALDRCDWFIVVLSPAAVTSTWVQRELLFALNEDRYRDRIVPILYKPCDWKQLSWTLAAIQMIDFSEEHGSGFRKLLALWGIEYKPRRRKKTARKRKKGKASRRT